MWSALGPALALSGPENSKSKTIASNVDICHLCYILAEFDRVGQQETVCYIADTIGATAVFTFWSRNNYCSLSCM